MRKLFFAALLALAACGGITSDGFAVDLTVIVDSQVQASQIATLTLSVSGAETYTSPAINVTGKLTSGHAGLRYKPGVATGTLSFGLTAKDSSGNELAYGSANGVVLKTGATTTATITLDHLENAGDMAVADLAAGDAAMQKKPDLLPPADLCVIKTDTDCDDGNPCTTDTVSDNNCGNTCVHTPESTAIACTVAASPTPIPGVCLGASCCSGCVDGTVCRPGNTDSTKCGVGGNDCVSCTATTGGTCSAGACTGCTVTSCTSASQTCGSSTCGYNCGSCPDSCISGALTHYSCGAESCMAGAPGGCGNYATCKDVHTCSTDCTTNGNSDCVSTAYCNASNQCVAKGGPGAACTAESGAYDYQCQAGLHCTWYSTDGQTLTAVCAHAVCSGCKIVDAADWTSCDGPIPYHMDPRTSCPYVDVCHANFCDGNGSCDSGSDALGGSRACGAVTCSAGSLHGMLCIADADGEGHTLCQSNVYGNCGGQQYDCPCASATTCPSTINFPGCMENR